MRRYILFGVGSPSDLKEFDRKYDSLGGRTIHEYLTKKGILHTEQPLLVSCHRTLRRAASYAVETELFANSGQRKVVVILLGGMSLALPGIFSSETATVPVIGVPAYAEVHGGGIDSSTAVYNLPPGTVVAGMPLHREGSTALDKAVLIAEKILDISKPALTLAAGKSGSSHAKKVEEVLSEINLVRVSSPGGKHEVIVSIAADSDEMIIHDKHSILALQCRSADDSAEELGCSGYSETLRALDRTDNTLYFGKAENAASFLRRVLALEDLGMRQSLIGEKKKQKEDAERKYGPKQAISDSIFV